MPSVGMRRTTRVFGVVKGVDGARVLRSGRRLWPESADSKVKKGSDRDEWYSFSDSKGSGGKQIGWSKNVNSKRESDVAETEKCNDHAMAEAKTEVLTEGDDNASDRMFGIVYCRRKRKALVLRDLDGKKYGIHFSRRQKRKKASTDVSHGFRGLAIVANSASSSDKSGLSSCLFSIWSYMKRVQLGLSELSGFFLAEPVSSVFAMTGIHFLVDPPTISGSGICKLFETRQSIPMFMVNFSAVPNCFLRMHVKLLLSHHSMPSASVNSSTDEQMYGDETCLSDDELGSGAHPPLPSKSEIVEAVVEAPGSRILQHYQPIRVSKLDGRAAQHRHGVNSRSVRKRRSSLRSRRSRNPSILGVNKKNGALASDLVSAKRSGYPFSSVVSGKKVRRSVRKQARLVHDTSPTLLDISEETDSSECAANILIIESDKCYRERGANVLLEPSASGEWFLVVKRDGVTRFSHKALEGMKPYISNRFTQSTVWTGENGWRLEFSERNDWLKFKDLYKECWDRNKQASPRVAAAVTATKIIPVPRVTAVSDYDDINISSFSRPDSYITVVADEVSRAMAKTTANYDMDTEDEEWLWKFNSEPSAESEPSECMTEENFELMIDAFEKAFYFNPHDFTNEKLDANICLDIGKSEVVEAVYSYWMRKRKQRRSALVRAFQGHQPKRAPLVPKPALRKRRSFKRQPSSHGRGKQPSMLQALAAERDAMEEQNSLRRLEEAKTNADRALEAALAKRQRAQFLTSNADLAAYRATMALRIAEAAEIAESPDEVAAHFLD